MTLTLRPDSLDWALEHALNFGDTSPGEYWYQVDGKPTQFVAGFVASLAKLKERAEVDTDLRTRFVEYITLEPPRGPRVKAWRK